jgi:hypothetical protein
MVRDSVGAVEAGLVGIELEVGGDMGNMDGGNCSVLGVAQDSTEHEDRKDGNRVDVDSAEGIVAAGVGELPLMNEVSHYQRPSHALQRELAVAQKKMKQCCLLSLKANLLAGM